MGPSINYVTPKGEGVLVKRYYWTFLLSNSIRILTEIFTQGGGGVQKLPILAKHNLWMAPIHIPFKCQLYIYNVHELQLCTNNNGVIQILAAIISPFVTCSNVPAISFHSILINLQYNFQNLNDKYFLQMVLSTSNQYQFHFIDFLSGSNLCFSKPCQGYMM